MGKTDLPGPGNSNGCAITVKSKEETLLIGGAGPQDKILSFNVESHTFKVLLFQLSVGRLNHRCAFVPKTNKIMITGGYNYGFLDSTEILDIEHRSVTMASPMNSKRVHHGMGVVTINGKDRFVVFGGHDGGKKLDSIEFYNTQTEKWEMTEFKLSEPKFGFGFLATKLVDILSKL